ncbi:hypothetical protein [Sandarakinorhabdus sp.]|uniref:hypothetical protein n=1 Tax=Sandarakinorhabdus sp. TaxID=1916663 RepID=UPI003F71F893
MRLLYCDETNMEERAGDFLLYGGLMIDAAQAGALSRAIDAIRAQHRVPEDYRLKFNPGPETFSHQQFIDLKREVLQTAHAHGAQLLIYLILHDVANDPDEARRSGINTVCLHFHRILTGSLDDYGMVLIDRFNDAGNRIEAHLRDKFTVGITGLPFTPRQRLSRIVGFHYSAIGQSHFPSIVDIALGSLRFAINAHTRGQDHNLATAGELIGLVSPMMWRFRDNNAVPEMAFTFRPQGVRHAPYRERYQSLKDFLTANGLVTTQEIVAQRQY